MKVKILAKLKSQFPGVPNNLLDRVASVLEKTVKTEEEIETAVTNSAGLVQEFSTFHQSEADRRVTEAVLKRENELKAEFGKKQDPKNDPKPDDIPVWAQSLIDANKALAEKVSAFESAGTQKSLSEKIVGIMAEKKIPAKYYGKIIEGRTFKDEAEMLAFATGIETDFNDFNQELVNSGFMQQSTPELGGQNKEGVSTAVQSFVDSKKAELEGKSQASNLGGKSL